MDSDVQAALALIIARPGIDSVALERALNLPAGFTNRRTYGYVQRGLIRVEKRNMYSRSVNVYFPTPDLVSNFSRMKFKPRDRNAPKAWTDEEIEMLVRDYPSRDTADMAQELGVTVRAVWAMAAEHGVTKTREYMQEAARKVAMRNNSLPPELREVIRLHNKLKRKLNEKY
ncbi:hypothetical protein KTE28_03685 [Burkholderia multivorans]|uniref:hypothetical protein n=1 Tax=Burkholderia multivorans TaxID=87883 RepID=UPI001C26430B|nr:hypothetical protein [Burkholderia multivorans]MBU9373434.1 hypothetical protein [Burkholderia multivorans]